jgi:tetratricopeptide (TPR) repeat protein
MEASSAIPSAQTSDARVAKRLTAIALGLALAVLALGTGAYWLASYLHGEEICIRCGVERDVDRRGPITWRSDPRASPYSSDSSLTECATHVWSRIGCWERGRATERCATPVVLAQEIARAEHGELDGLRRLIEQLPADAPALRSETHAWLAYALHLAGDPEASLAELEPALAEDPTNPWLHYEQGRDWTTMGEFERALASYQRATELDPSFARAWQWLGHCLRVLRRPEEALAADTKALELAETADERTLAAWRTNRATLLREILDERALVHEALGDHDEAERDRERMDATR